MGLQKIYTNEKLDPSTGANNSSVDNKCLAYFVFPSHSIGARDTRLKAHDLICRPTIVCVSVTKVSNQTIYPIRQDTCFDLTSETEGGSGVRGQSRNGFILVDQHWPVQIVGSYVRDA